MFSRRVVPRRHARHAPPTPDAAHATSEFPGLFSHQRPKQRQIQRQTERAKDVCLSISVYRKMDIDRYLHMDICREKERNVCEREHEDAGGGGAPLPTPPMHPRSSPLSIVRSRHPPHAGPFKVGSISLRGRIKLTMASLFSLFLVDKRL